MAITNFDNTTRWTSELTPRQLLEAVAAYENANKASPGDPDVMVPDMVEEGDTARFTRVTNGTDGDTAAWNNTIGSVEIFNGVSDGGVENTVERYVTTVADEE